MAGSRARWGARPILHRRTLLVAIAAKDTTLANLRLHQRLTGGTFVVEDTPVNRHDFCGDMSARRQVRLTSRSCIASIASHSIMDIRDWDLVSVSAILFVIAVILLSGMTGEATKLINPGFPPPRHEAEADVFARQEGLPAINRTPSVTPAS